MDDYSKMLQAPQGISMAVATKKRPKAETILGKKKKGKKKVIDNVFAKLKM